MSSQPQLARQTNPVGASSRAQDRGQPNHHPQAAAINSTEKGWAIAQPKRAGHLVCVWKTHPQENDPLWKRLVHRHIYLPIFRFFYRVLDFAQPSKINPDGSFEFLEQLTFTYDLWRAELEASKYPGGYVIKNLPVDDSVGYESVKADQIHPNSAVPDQPAQKPPSLWERRLLHKADELEQMVSRNKAYSQ